MKKTIMNTKYIWLLAILLGFTACSDDDDSSTTAVPLPTLTAGEANFSNYVSLGNSLTAGFSDGALFIATQENSFPNILAGQFALAGGGSFTQPLMNDNFGGMALGGNRIMNPRLVTTGGPPQSLESVIGPVTVTTDLLVNNPTGPFNNMGVPGAASFHLLAPGYGNLANLQAGLANPFFIRMTGSTPDATVLELAMAQAPTFFSLWIGNNDVLSYATNGADGSLASITDQATFDAAYAFIVGTLTTGGTQGVIANIPYVTDVPHFTTVPYNPIPLDAATAEALNSGYAAYNGGLQFALANGAIDAAEAEARTIIFTEDEENAMVLIDEDLTDLSGFGIPSYRQATEDDLFVLPLASLIPQGYGTAIQLEDRWVLTPQEQDEIKTATDNFNATIQAMASQAGLAFVDANAFLSELKISGISSGDLIFTSDLVTGGMFSLDGVHLTSRGYALVANKFMEAIDTTYGSNFEASGNFLDVGQYPTNYSPLLQ